MVTTGVITPGRDGSGHNPLGWLSGLACPLVCAMHQSFSTILWEVVLGDLTCNHLLIYLDGIIVF